MKFLLCIFLTVFLQQAKAISAEDEGLVSADGSQIELNEQQINYLVKYGYLDEAVVKHQDEINNAIKALQKFFLLPVTGIIDKATSTLMKSPRCGNPDIYNNKTRYALSPDGGWRKKQLTYYIVNVTSQLDLEMATNLTQKALNEWGAVSGLTFTRKDDTSADLVLTFHSRYHGDGFPFGDGVLAHAFYPNTPQYDGEVHFYEVVDWAFHTPTNKKGIDFYTVTLHELGHSLGLDHSNVPTSIMWPGYKVENNALDYDDILGMYELYIKNPPPDYK